MIVEETRNRELVERVLKHPEIYERITQDGAPKCEDYQIYMPKKAIFLSGSEDGELVGVMIFDPLGPVCFDCHIHVLPEKRTRALVFAKSCFDWLWTHTAAIKITAQIATYFPDVLGFANKCGFVPEGINSRSFVKGGRIYDQIYLGLYR